MLPYGKNTNFILYLFYMIPINFYIVRFKRVGWVILPPHLRNQINLKISIVRQCGQKFNVNNGFCIYHWK